MNKTCPLCGKGFLALGKRKYCDECRHNKKIENMIYRTKRYPRIDVEKECKMCGKKFTIQCGYGTHSQTRRKYCSPECKRSFAKRRDKHTLVCAVCGKHFQNYQWKKTCSDECRKQYFINISGRMLKKCPICGEMRETAARGNGSNKSVSTCNKCRSKRRWAQGIGGLEDFYIIKHLFRRFGIRNPDQTLIETQRQQILSKRLLKQLKEWRHEHESDRGNV